MTNDDSDPLQVDGVAPSAARARQAARALSQLTGVVGIVLDPDGRVVAWTASAAAMIDPLGKVHSDVAGLGLDFELDCLADEASRSEWRRNSPSAAHGPCTVRLLLGVGPSAAEFEMAVRVTPSVFQSGAERGGREGRVLIGSPVNTPAVGLAIIDADFRRVVDAWPAAEALLSPIDGWPGIPFSDEQRSAIREVLARGQATRARIPSGSTDGRTRWLQLDLVHLAGVGEHEDCVMAVVTEVSEARRAKLDLEEREQRLRTVVEATSTATGRGFLRSLVKALSRALGVRVAYVSERLDESAPKLRMLCLWSGRDFTSGYEYPVEGTLDGQVLAEGPVRSDRVTDPQSSAHISFAAEGLERFFGIPIPNAEGTAIGVLGVMSDGPLDRELPVEEILNVFAARVGAELERLRAEEALRASEDRWRTVLENAPDLILSLDRDGRVLFHNQPRLEDFPDAGDSVSEHLGDEDGPRLLRAVQGVFDSGEALALEFEASFGRRDSSWYSARIGPLRRGDLVTSVILVATDVTESKQREALRELRSTIEQRITSVSTELLNLSADRIDAEIGRALAALAIAFRSDCAAIYQSEPDDSGMIASHAWSRPGREALPNRIGEEGLLGWFTGRVNREREVVITSDKRVAPESRVDWIRLGLKRLVGVRFELRDSRSGTLVLGTDQVDSLDDFDHELVSLLHISADLFANAFEREHAEQQRAALEQELQHSQRMEAIGNLAGGIAHDFNNLLTGIMGYSSLLSEAGSSDPKVAKAARVIEKAAERASSMTSQLLGFARRREAEFNAVDVHALIAETVELLQRTLPETTELKVDLPSERSLVWGDAGLLSQVLVNLAVNGSDALQQRPGSIEFRTEQLEVQRESAVKLPELSPGAYLVIEVTDDGSGMTEGVVERIFEPFFTTKEAGRGTGMGLSVVYGIVRRHGGAIRCRSALGIGTSFKIWLPKADEMKLEQELSAPMKKGADTEQVAPAVEQLVLKGACLKVLVVDDEPVVLATASALLDSFGYQVLEADSGQAAIDLFKEQGEEIDLVLLDLKMPGMDGRQCFAQLRALDPDVRGVLSSGFGYEGLVDKIAKDGFIGFAQKPYRRSDLDRLIRSALGSQG
ncbi:MAG: hybrid sensor histidine kinase/response regulator [Planctomycetota bacterium]